MSIQRRAFGGVGDWQPVLDLIRAAPAACRHTIDFPWRLTAPAIAASLDAAYWQDADGRVVGLAAWQQVWATSGRWRALPRPPPMPQCTASRSAAKR